MIPSSQQQQHQQQQQQQQHRDRAPGHRVPPPSLSLIPHPDATGAAVSVDAHEPVSNNSDQGHDSQTESASSRETWPIEVDHHQDASNLAVIPAGKERSDKTTIEYSAEQHHNQHQQVARRVSIVDKLSLREVAGERVESIAERMSVMPDELLEDLKNELRAILEATGGSHHREEFSHLQKLLQGRADLNATALLTAHRVQMEILVAINTGIQAFLHPNFSLPQNQLIEIFLYKRCRNIACRTPLPADDCGCDMCSTRKGFCCLCMCVICNKFDFEVNTCRWIGCDLCSHWTHTDCAIRVGKIGMGASSKSGVPTSSAEMLFRCQACNRTSELLGWVKDVFQHCAPSWDREALARELDFVCRIFRGSEDPRGRKLFRKCEDLIEKLKNGSSESLACRGLQVLFQELEMDSLEGEEASRLIAPQEACNRIAVVVQEALRKMEMVAEEKKHLTKRARMALEACDRELEDKAREVAELKIERQRKKQQVEELESIVRLKQAEAEMFQFKATEARREAERLQSIVLAKSEKAEQEYASRYLKARMEEAEMEKQYIFEKIKLQESQRGLSPGSSSGAGGDSSKALMMSKVQDLLKNVYVAPSKSDEKLPSEHRHFGSTS